MLNMLYDLVSPWATASKMQIFKNRSLGRIVNYVYPMYCGSAKIAVPRKTSAIIVSLTSFPARMDKLYLCINSLLRQSVTPEKVLLWLAESQFPNGEGIDTRLRKLEGKVFEIRFCDDLRSYKKIFYTAQEYSDRIIVTADDDTLYPENWLENLVETHLKYPKCVVCYRAHEVTFRDGKLRPYAEWNGLSPGVKGPKKQLVPIGVGGILYPHGFFDGVEFDSKLIKELCPYSDDLWLKVLALRKNVPAVKVFEETKEWFTIRKSQKQALMEINAGQNENDAALARLLEYYSVNFED